ncbi:DNA/RNA non-specific endonuclease, partial [Bacteroides ovatus]|uniref:DNA/RNA non-specific endonuclease n=1 Tax=Bacteroides kribbi TaxID=1912894 RepID=UPI00356A2E07
GKILSNFLLLRYLKKIFYNSVAELRYIKNEIAIPKYFFMAVLFRSGDNYKAIGFYMPHENLKDDPDKKDPKKYLMSIDALEQETGIDFFHNLPDNIENTVEATYNVNDWQW